MKKAKGKRESTGKAESIQHQAARSEAVLGRRAEAPSGTPADEPPPKWAWHYHQLVACRKRLLQERRQHSDEAAQENPHYSMSMADAATDEADRDLLLSELSSEQELLYEVEEALHRMDEGTYGICQMTGQPIPGRRLKAVPWARFTVEAQAEMEKQNTDGHPHLGRLGSIRRRVKGNLEGSESEEDKPEIVAQDEALRTTRNPPS